MEVKTAIFIESNTEVDKCPNPDKPEYAFIGRSNVGKSSLINMLTNHKKLAKVSGTPGKTQLINHFLINGDERDAKKGWYLVDLPGYGYAKTSKKKRSEFQGYIYKYIEKRSNLMCVFLLVDSRHAPQKNDVDFMTWMGERRIPFVIVFTKIDKVSSSEKGKNLRIYQKELLKTWETIPQHFLSSSASNFGRDEILKFIDQTNAIFSED